MDKYGCGVRSYIDASVSFVATILSMWTHTCDLTHTEMCDDEDILESAPRTRIKRGRNFHNVPVGWDYR